MVINRYHEDNVFLIKRKQTAAKSCVVREVIKKKSLKFIHNVNANLFIVAKYYVTLVKVIIRYMNAYSGRNLYVYLSNIICVTELRKTI